MPRGLIAFATGLAASLVGGWVVFPRVLYVRQPQPFAFRHQTHAAKSGTAQCVDCHVLRPDGAFAGIPKVESCAGCHAAPMGDTAAEATLVNQYVKPGLETPWRVYSRQPSNVRFSHAIHTRRAALDCAECHGTLGRSDELRPYEVNRISGYSRDIGGRSISPFRHGPGEGMKMSDCEDCHRKHNVEAGCLGCHQ